MGGWSVKLLERFVFGGGDYTVKAEALLPHSKWLAAFFAFGFFGGGGGGEFAAFFGGPVGFGGLAAAGDAEGVGWDVFSDYGAGGDVGAVAKFYGSDEDGVTAYEDAVADGGGMFGEAVVIAGDGAGADVGFGADFGVADVGEMRGLAAFADGASLDFDEIADFCAFQEMGFRAEAR